MPLKRIARYSKVTNEALVFGYREGNRLIISQSYSGVPRHSDRHQIEFCTFAALRICRVLTGHVSKIAWLLGFHEMSAFTNAFKRWTGKTPSQMRIAGASSAFGQAIG